eukprot:CAMPEP_0175068922 /NCGR_PEP_ID=MMETSP0052_2-20121109/17928_1 /TAXON_ID=51329 ORGANISM="Polytomella parva, Strain SAG 63-3" /NCGR_SAMPLE_ID=MMETSP0052_2 /ASSEMBLY_ACC=CAM_ASM_000194 /LENGTH=440 /DNA_ID=CAMNT_0016335979 /DNA_START=213 /DNA_END=1532 /DNA_ORIENTATION=-
MQHGRFKYQKRKIELHKINDSKHLQILLFSAERAWAHAMDLKQATERVPDHRQRNHLARRLARASRWAAELAAAASVHADNRTALETEAYHSWLSGQFYIERLTNSPILTPSTPPPSDPSKGSKSSASLVLVPERQTEAWVTALARLTRARRIFLDLSRLARDAESQSLCLSTADDIDSSIRFCNYKLQSTRSSFPIPQSEEDLLAFAQNNYGAEGRGGGCLDEEEQTATEEEREEGAGGREDRMDVEVDGTTDESSVAAVSDKTEGKKDGAISTAITTTTTNTTPTTIANSTGTTSTTTFSKKTNNNNSSCNSNNENQTKAQSLSSYALKHTIDVKTRLALLESETAEEKIACASYVSFAGVRRLVSNEKAKTALSHADVALAALNDHLRQAAAMAAKVETRGEEEKEVEEEEEEGSPAQIQARGPGLTAAIAEASTAV